MFSGVDLVQSITVPERARDVKRLRHQLSFDLEETFPSCSVLDYYDDYLRSRGWTRCESAADDWSAFFDKPRNERIHRIGRYWVKRDDNQLATLLAEYASPGDNDDPPTSKMQTVTLIIGESLFLEHEIEDLNLKCRVENEGP